MATSMSLDTTTFSLNGETWTIIQVPSIGDEVTTIGETEYHTRTIRLLDWVDKTTRIRTSCLDVGIWSQPAWRR